MKWKLGVCTCTCIGITGPQNGRNTNLAAGGKKPESKTKKKWGQGRKNKVQMIHEIFPQKKIHSKFGFKKTLSLP